MRGLKRININAYQKGMGELIDLSGVVDYNISHHPDAINIPYQRLMLYYDHYLDKNKSYYLTCHKGIHSAKAVTLLEYLGYDFTQAVT